MIYNKDCYAVKVRRHPLPGKLPCIHAIGDFREVYNIMTVISPNPDKPATIEYTIGEGGNGISEAFVGSMMYLIAKIFLRHHNLL
jgi:hypothetical protein